MLLGFNLLLWTTEITEEHFPLFETLKKTGYDGVELPLFGGTPEQYAVIGSAIRDAGVCAAPQSVSCLARRPIA